MKKLLSVIFLALSGVLGEAPAPYPPSGFRPAGPAFELPQRQNTPSQQYLPVDPRRPLTPNNEYGPPEEEDVSVQGLPTQEQLPIFQGSPINGQEYVGPALQTDLKNLDQSFQQSQYQQQQQRYREYARQKELETARARNNANGQATPAVPRQFVPRTTITPEPTFTTTETPSTTEALDLNEGETLEESKPQKNAKTSVEVSKQRLQEYPGEFFLSSLAQLQLQQQLVPIQQLGQLRAPLFVPPTRDVSQRQVLSGYDAQTHFAALPSVLAQRQVLQPQGVVQNQQPFQNPGVLVAQQQPTGFAPSPVQPLNQYQPVVPQVQQFPQIQAQPAFGQPQPVNPNVYGQPRPDTEDVEVQDPQLLYQQTYQPQLYQQPNIQQFPQEQQNLLLSQAQVNYPNQNQGIPNQPQSVGQQPGQFPQQGYQGQDAFLQSGLDVNQQGNGVEDDESDDQDGSTATSVATAFGTRTQPRVYTQYGAPVPVPRAQLDPNYQTTTESTAEATTDGPAVAEASAVAVDGKRRSAKLRSRRVRPVFTLDRSGHLVLAPEQN
ncbi:PAX-interacting protein 1-like [Galleria mellonella]|uniref:PAX-interacting protein 1-like n=1 Tax=Galleria mellonella TaxID=7137 RepID=A0ABM3M921_GALME|nr:PAX-interacting protein 1-like [Galleria mellonella]